MSELANQFSAIFRDEHRAVRDGLLELTESFKKRDREKVVALLGQVASLTGPHFRYEEETLYPALVEIFGPKYIEKLLADHDRVIGSAGRLVQLAGKGSWSNREVAEAVELVRDMLPHVSDCDGLSIMVERLPEEKIRDVLDARQRCNEAGLDLLRWVQEARERPIHPPS